MTDQSQKTAYQRLKEFESKGCHMLIPTGTSPAEIAPGFALIVEPVRIHKQGLDRLAQAAKVDWLPAQIVRDPNVSGRMMASVEGMIRTSTGEPFRVQDIAGGQDVPFAMEG